MKRFWKDVAVEPHGDAWQVLLDSRAVKTQGRNPQLLPTRAMADLVAAEFAAQGEEIDLGAFVHRDMADYAIDIVAPDRATHITKLLAYAETDTLCYRADPDEPLFRRQETVWEPIVTACETAHGVKLERASGIVHRPQSETTTAALRRRLEAEDAFTLAALLTLTSLATSLVVGLAMLEGGADAEALFAASNLEEDWQAELWGRDHEAQAVRDMKLAEFRKAAEFADAARARS
ncbi:ATP12 family chaperone protein [Aurantiacibacter poecillastricola]|uniref:ATP12 family chaperone protein n=1 Tax=Aurantiacibacter poecillastricola TaxID=3064385 RepID=UPI00273D0CB3|nr:ATP12 family protein [Aurantiacibacter sp. 219JJ12-13]MDP5262796.1 ATP12 family protein [Aurantiacibacter sp. 219JJ12-13]